MGHPTTLPKLFQPTQVGNLTLGHRVVLAPLTRCRANKNGVHSAMAVEYYAQRASFPGTLLITEATCVASFARGRIHAPGIYTDEQVAAWKPIADAIHAKGSFAFMQIWAMGRSARVEDVRKDDPDFAYVSASDIPLTGREETPRPLTKAEIKEYAAAFAQAAKRAIDDAGFDGVEIHAAHGYLVDQFLQEMSNKRTDEYGGSVENRCRFALEIVDAVSRAVGQERTAIRISPWSDFQDMRMPDPVPTFEYLVSRLVADHPDLAFLHVVEPGVSGSSDMVPQSGESNEFIRKLWYPRPLVSAGGYTRERALQVAEESGQLVAFGRMFVSNPDLPLRLLKDIPLTPWDRSVFYIPEEPHGYIDYPFAKDAEEGH
ncbi:NADH:flavin oxidoreductase/NADH oxidase [Trametes maxima]|nr:NADH:flavin oxidoreductase/NADH oxidase [Trametes maxima]